MGNIQCSKCGIPAAYYDYSPERMGRLSCQVRGTDELKKNMYEHQWVDHWKDKRWYDILLLRW